MKYIVILGDGMADQPLLELENRTPLEVAVKPEMDDMARHGQVVGMAQTVPKGMAPGSDTANLSVMGYNPEVCYTGRSPLEALSMGVELREDDVTFRVNFVTLSEEETPYEEKRILDHGAGEITTKESRELMKAIAECFGDEIRSFYPGISYRHLLVWNGGSTKVELTPPHDIRGQHIKGYLPKGQHSDKLYEFMRESYAILDKHPVNEARRAKGLLPANSIWIWGEGTKPGLDNFYDKYGLHGGMISAVDLLKGIGKGGGLKVYDIEGATGNLHTNYQGKVDAALKGLKEGLDFVYVHVEAPDECGHMGDLEGKIKAIEYLDEKVIGPIRQGLEEIGEQYRLLLLPDHPTPLSICTHTDDPVPFVIYDSRYRDQFNCERRYTEIDSMKSPIKIDRGYTLMDDFIEGGK